MSKIIIEIPAQRYSVDLTGWEEDFMVDGEWDEDGLYDGFIHGIVTNVEYESRIE